MAINSNQYVRIISAVAGGASVPTQALHGRRFTTNDLLPVGTILETDYQGVISYFGAESAEAKEAAAYFGYLSPAPASAPSLIQFAAWARTARPARIYGEKETNNLASIPSSGTLGLSVDGVDYSVPVTGLDSGGSFSAIGALLQNALASSGISAIEDITVTYLMPEQRFVFTSGSAGPSTMSATNTPLNNALGITQGAINSSGSAVESFLSAYTSALTLSDNYGAASLMLGEYETLDFDDDILPVAQFVNTENGAHRFDWAVTGVEAWLPDVQNIGFNSWNMVSENNPVDLMPSAITAATNYNLRNGAPGYMYRQNGNLQATVFDDAKKAQMDALKVNYIGRTMSAGTFIDFYQMGDLTGVATNPRALNVQTNEMWLKAAAKSTLLNLQISLSLIPATIDGRGMIYGALAAGPISQGLLNGTIAVGKTINANQSQAIYQITGDPLAAGQIENVGWWLHVQTSGTIATYTLVYAVSDQIRKIEGSHNLI